MNSTVKTVLFWVGIGVSALVLWTVIQQGRNGQKDADVNFSQFMTDVDQGKVREVTVDGQQVHGKFSRRLRLPYRGSGGLSRHDQGAARQERRGEHQGHQRR